MGELCAKCQFGSLKRREVAVVIISIYGFVEKEARREGKRDFPASNVCADGRDFLQNRQ